jgi:DNA-binding transcriptional LysR family regulator
MLKLESIAAFASIAESGSMTSAARRLGLSRSVVSERLAELERMLGARLFNRTTRTLLLTGEGEAFYERAKLILRDVDQAASELSELRGTLSGPLRISAPVGFGYLHLGPALFGFLAKHTAIDLTLELDDRFVDIMAEGYDAVVRHGPVADKRIIVKRYGKPTSVKALEEHRGIIYSNRGAVDWRFRVGRKFAAVRPAAVLRVNNGLLMRDAAIAGLGIALLPTFFLEGPLKKRTLKIIDVHAEAEGATIYIAYPEHLRSSAKIGALTAWLRTSFGEPAYWDRA